MKLTWSDEPWKRVNDGLPPLARNVELHGQCAGRIVNFTEFNPDESIKRERYDVEVMIAGQFFELDMSTEGDPDEALKLLAGWLIESSWDGAA